ncbi:Ribosomal RNA large subunit methyltransferase K/L [Candidatus Erwinia haradaeae]|uniref:Ribosomal RNA large subunit methyltransferase K/L, partial n=1 Tax=Candidatus Erwinia haradaeae TaxID=1922217 RepID=A0A451D0B2_9GAMM|nr:Ribosomal RNA large subunit methyltransferase K/L [Candidatus Erwinia haradaeae]
MNNCVLKYESMLRSPIDFFLLSGQYIIDYANRLRKNIKKLDKWAKVEKIECYRIYDCDLPDYKVTIDRYGDWILIQEYSAPHTINPSKAQQRLSNVITTTIDVLDIPLNKIILKIRTKQKGRNRQYQKLNNNGKFLEIMEFNAKLLVNLTDYLDTGIFLDNRNTRKILGKMSNGKKFLNLFSYTGSASVHAGLGGALSTTTIDISNTYINWAQRNMLLNGLSGHNHRFIQTDCLNWLHESIEKFDLIFIDPPTFTNSKRMKNNFDIQRDHLEIITNLKRLLHDNGSIIFSNNKRSFKLNLTGLNLLKLKVTELSAKTKPKDFFHSRPLHSCWLITHLHKN